jgi:hypothetical protein
LCKRTGCTLSAPRRIAAITIDGASFSHESLNGYRLAFTLRNSAATPVEMPALELSLLDTDEHVLVRRVLPPTQFNIPAALPAHAEQWASLPLELTGPEAATLAPVAGYRLIAFYP